MGTISNLRPGDRALAGGGEPPHDGGMEARVAKLEAAMEHVQTDIADIKTDVRELRKELGGFRDSIHADMRWLLGAMAGAFLILLAAMAHGFHWI